MFEIVNIWCAFSQASSLFDEFWESVQPAGYGRREVIRYILHKLLDAKLCKTSITIGRPREQKMVLKKDLKTIYRLMKGMRSRPTFLCDLNFQDARIFLKTIFISLQKLLIRFVWKLWFWITNLVLRWTSRKSSVLCCRLGGGKF